MFYRILTSAKPRPVNDIWQYIRLDFVSVNAYAKFYHFSRFKMHVYRPVSLFHSLDLGKASTNDKRYLTNPLC